jgi:hypothetical protein
METLHLCVKIFQLTIYTRTCTLHNVHSMLKILDNVNILAQFILVLYKHVYQTLLLVCYFH